MRYSDISLTLSTDAPVPGGPSPNQKANITFFNVSLTGGASYQSVSLIVVRPLGTSRMSVQFRPTLLADLKAIGLTEDASWIADPTARGLEVPNLRGVPI
jgi:hypothetical protein